MSIKMKLRAAQAAAASWLPDALMAAGSASVSCGIGMVYRPAGWIMAGIFALAAGYALARGGK